MKTYTLRQAIELKKCPICDKSLQENNIPLIISMSDIEKDCITKFICPFCKSEFQRDIKEMKKVCSNGNI